MHIRNYPHKPRFLVWVHPIDPFQYCYDINPR